MEIDLYVCSKPLQYFNIKNIKNNIDDSSRVLVILGFFVDAESFYKNVQEFDKSWYKVLFFKHQYEFDLYFLFHPVRKIFVEVDNSLVYGIFHLVHLYREMYVFEEGFGSYRRDRYDNSKGLKKILNRLLGVGKHVGFSSFLTGQYLYLPELYKKQFPCYIKNLYSFEQDFLSQLNSQLPFFLKTSPVYDDICSLKNKRIGIYLTNHKINFNILSIIQDDRRLFDFVYIKPHPHIQNLTRLDEMNINVIHTNIMVEFLFLILLKNNNKLVVYHENSTSVIWFQHVIECRNLGDYFEDYNIVSSFIYEKFSNLTLNDYLS